MASSDSKTFAPLPNGGGQQCLDDSRTQPDGTDSVEGNYYRYSGNFWQLCWYFGKATVPAQKA
jgi:hypothetical protein